MTARLYELIGPATDPVVADRFRTAATPDASADENAITNLIEHSRLHPAAGYVLAFVTDCDGLEHRVPICEARNGHPVLLVAADDVAADAMHAGPDIVHVAEFEQLAAAAEVA